jgi:hypothetical protein
LKTENLLDILQILEPVNPTVKKIRTFYESDRVPHGFPVQIGSILIFTKQKRLKLIFFSEIPVIATLSMKVSIQHFHWRDPKESFSEEMFKIPESFHEDPKHFRNM